MATPPRPPDNHLHVGTSIVSHLSEAFYEDTARVFEEYLVNASDALATHVSVQIEPSFVVITDDGEGMSPEELRRFFFIAHSKKKAGETRNVPFGRGRSIARQIIGQFGLGKLSAYRFADKLAIRTWKAGMESKASLSFSDLTSKEFIDDFILEVQSKPTKETGSGTEVVMTGMKQKIYPKTIVSRLAKRLTIRSDMEIIINDEVLEAQRPAGKLIEIKEEDPQLGKIFGTLLYLDKANYEQSGVSVRVYGRVVNLNPRLLHSLVNVTGAMSASQKTVLDVNVDSMAEALLAHRNGFNEDDPLFEALQKWIRKFLNSHNYEYVEERKVENAVIQEAGVLTTLKSRLTNQSMSVGGEHAGARTRPRPKKRITDRKAALKEAHVILERKDDLALHFKGKKFVFELGTLGEDQSDWRLEGTRVIINASHPLFQEAKKRRSQDLYCLKTAIVAIAVETSRTMADFRQNYEELTRLAASNMS